MKEKKSMTGFPASSIAAAVNGLVEDYEAHKSGKDAKMPWKPIPGKAQSYRDLPEDDKVKMMAPVDAISETILSPDFKPPENMAMDLVSDLLERITNLETAATLNYTERKKLEEKISTLKFEKQGLEDLVTIEGGRLDTIQTALDNQTVASTDAINGLVEQTKELKAICLAQHSLILRMDALLDPIGNPMMKNAIAIGDILDGSIERETKVLLENLKMAKRRQNTEPRKTGG